MIACADSYNGLHLQGHTFHQDVRSRAVCQSVLLETSPSPWESPEEGTFYKDVVWVPTLISGVWMKDEV